MLKLEDVMYKDFQNDISFLIREKIFVLGEHQSTINENMPLRFLLYIGRLYETLLAVEDRYKEKRIPLPAPEFYVFYNGEKKYPAYKLLKLSDSFLVKGRPTFDLEVTVHVYNPVSYTHLDVYKRQSAHVFRLRSRRVSRFA